MAGQLHARLTAPMSSTEPQMERCNEHGRWSVGQQKHVLRSEDPCFGGYWEDTTWRRRMMAQGCFNSADDQSQCFGLLTYFG